VGAVSILRLVTALLSMHRSPEPLQFCMVRFAERTAVRLQEAYNQLGVPPELLLALSYNETHIGCDRNEGGGWGAPIDRLHRHTAGTYMHAARVLRNGWDYCRAVRARSWMDLPGHQRIRVRATSWMRAVAFYRCGMCECPHLVGYQPADGFRLAREIEAAVGTGADDSGVLYEPPATAVELAVDP